MRVKLLTALVLGGIGFVSLPKAYAHDSIAATYVVPDDILVWQTYDETLHGELNSNDLTYLPGWFIGVGGGSTKVAPEGSSGGFYVKDDRDWGYKIFVGQRILPHWSAELSFVDTGEAGLTNNNPAIASTFKDATISYKIPTVSASYHLFGPKRRVDVFGRIGFSTILNTVSDSRISYEKQTSLQLNIGGGVQWRFAPKWFVRAEFDSFDNDASIIGISIARYFGRHDEHREVVPDLIEPPVPIATCATFNGSIDEIRFEVDSDVITKASYPALLEASEALVQFQSIKLEIQAHSDSSASEAYNLDLSERRANAVKAFLVEQGVSEQRLIATGYGESKPRATNDTKEGRALNRRVEFRVIDESACR
ncbi:OmpA family protein [Reinekea forsetii]|nr:OmpA family protein [Reinekea forsetii]